MNTPKDFEKVTAALTPGSMSMRCCSPAKRPTSCAKSWGNLRSTNGCHQWSECVLPRAVETMQGQHYGLR